MPAPRVVHFYSDGFKLEADYWAPAGATPTAKVPGIVLCPGYGAIRKHTLPDYADYFVAAGIAVCSLDYRGFGGSEGKEDRNIPYEQAQDIRAALTWLGLQPEVDPARLGLWGTSGGGAHVPYVTGIDTRVKCAVAQIGHGDGNLIMSSHKTPEELAKLKADIKADREQRVLTGKSGKLRTIDLVTDPGTRGYVLGVAEKDPSIISYLTYESAEAAFEYRPIDVVDRIAPRALMFIAGEKDEICPPAHYKEVFDRTTGAKRWLVYPIGHYEMYTPQWIQKSAEDAIAWYKQHL
jgi:dipeptidyl aminopeptidase/acylaminoacyl peptidase